MPSCNTSYLGFCYLGRGVSLHGYSSQAQLLLLTLDEGYVLTAAIPDLQRGIAPLGPPVTGQPPLLGPGLGRGWLLPAAVPGLGCEVASAGRQWPQTRGVSSQPPLTSDAG